jgi:hypothetical protein
METHGLKRVSQSLMKNFSDYTQGMECGLVLKAKYVDHIAFPSTDAMRLGQYFEYIATGGLPAYGDGTPPEPELVYKGKPNEKLSTAYERAHGSAQLFKALIKQFDIEIIEVGWAMQHENMSGTADLLVKWDGKYAILDLKYSGLVDDKWNDMGWHKDFLSQKDKIMMQSVHYSILAEKILGEPVDFYFWVFATQDPRDVRIFKAVIDDTKIELHNRAVKQVYDNVNKLIANDSWKPLPSLQKCMDCPLVDTCPSASLLPNIVPVYY